jgi:pimeloyl-ACP methyl ester carboxylesterase
MEHVDVRGLRIAFQRRGQGPCLLLLHGAVSDSRVWRVQLESLSDTFTVVAWDAPGCGGSSDAPDHFRLPEYAECLRRSSMLSACSGRTCSGPAWVTSATWSRPKHSKRRSVTSWPRSLRKSSIHHATTAGETGIGTRRCAPNPGIMRAGRSAR